LFFLEGKFSVQRILERGEIESLDHISIERLRLPSAQSLFVERAARLRRLAAGEVIGTPVNPALSGYLLLMADLVEAQHAVIQTLSVADAMLPDEAALESARRYAMPPMPALADLPPLWLTIFDRLLTQLDATSASRPQLVPILAALRALDHDALEVLADAILTQRPEALGSEQATAHAPFVAAALQVWWTYRASQLSPKDVPALETGALCPVCGSQPVASVIRIGGQSQGYRYLHCGVCASEWHMVRVKCSNCEQNAKIAYQGLDSRGDVDHAEATDAPLPLANKANDPQKVIRAETCDDCLTYRKIVNQEHDYEVEPLADDLASLMLDVLVTEEGYIRASINPLLWFSGAV
jgi:FdhE protein